MRRNPVSYYDIKKRGEMMSRKTVLITGSSRGVGKAAALRFAREGFDVVINCDKRKAELEQTKGEIEALGVSCAACVCDVGDAAACEEMFGMLEKTYGRLDVLINNAGISYIGLLQDMTPEDFAHVIDADLTSVFNCCRLAIPLMLKERRGKIINVSSVWGNTGASCEVAYSAAKGGVNAFTKALARELGPNGIQVNAVALGAIDTEMNAWMNDEERADLIKQIPSDRLGTADEAAGLIWQLACADDYLTGQVIPLDGGWT